MSEAWSKWWFLNGGGIHRAEKYGEVNQLARYARELPKAAWDEASKEVERLTRELAKRQKQIEALLNSAAIEQKRYMDAEAEAARYREALEWIAMAGGDVPTAMLQSEFDARQLSMSRRKARQALQPGEETK